MRANQLVTFTIVGLLIGAFAGYLTRPEAAEIRLGPMSIEVQGGGAARGGGPLTSGQMQHIALLTAIGGIIGAGIGFVMGRRA